MKAAESALSQSGHSYRFPTGTDCHRLDTPTDSLPAQTVTGDRDAWALTNGLQSRWCAPLDQMPTKKLRDCDGRLDPVGNLAPAMTFVGKQ